MAEYDLICDICSRMLDPQEGIVSWTGDGEERGFALTHPACVPAENDQRLETRRLASPNEYLAFVTARLGRTLPDPRPLAAIVWALAPLVLRHDSASEMDAMRAASFGQRLGVKPGTSPGARSAQHPRDVEAGK
jgi:hypothetical protein